ncbi:MAG: ABC transporter permease [Chloracidobacterium sp.]|nr:ABC transporter permease [Chloracidobacterium sp.]
MIRILQYLFQFVSQLWLRLLPLLRRRRYERDMEAEMRFHLEMQIEQNLASGMASEEAHYAARRQFGNQTWLKEVSREMWSLTSIEMMIQDLRYGARMLAKNPGFTSLAVLTLALGIGSTTTIFSAIQNILLDPFPYKDASRVVTIQIHDTSESRPGGRSQFQAREFLDYQEQSRVFEDVIGITLDDMLYDNGAGMEQFLGGYVTPNAFSFLGVAAELGRGVTPDDARPGAPPVFVMAHKLWVKRFNQDPSILGKTFTLNGEPKTLVGIMPPRFIFYDADVWIARAVDRGDPRANRDYWLFLAKLKPGSGFQQAQADIELIARRLAQVYPDNYPKNFSVQIIRWVDSLVGQFRKALYTIAAAVGLLLLIACGNVANMLLARATAREKEMAIRSAVGANRMRMVGQLLTESLLLALSGAVVGCLFSYAGVMGLAMLRYDNFIPEEAQIRLNLAALLFSLVTAVITAALFGLAPALQTVRKNLVEPLKGAGPGAGGGFGQGRIRNALVVFEVALSLVLLSGAGLLTRSFVKLQQMDLGFNPENILFARLPFPRGQYTTAAEKQRFYEQLLSRLRALPGVVTATETTSLPPYGGIDSDVDLVGKTHTEKWRATFQLCSEGYFPTLQLRTILGRTLSETEVHGARKVAVVNQTFVNKFLGDEYPIGRMIKINMLESMPDSPVKDPVFEVIGVISDARNQGVQEPPAPEMFVPYTITGAFERGILIRTSAPPLSLLNDVRREIQVVDRSVALTLTGSLEDFLKRYSYAEPQFSLVLMSVFASVGLTLVALGVFSLIAYTVARQTREIGVRMAMGAGHGDIVWMVLRRGLQLVGSGVGVGLLASFAVTRVIANQLWGVSPRDPLTLGAVVAVVALAGLAACYFPARRATKVDPLVAIRAE